MSALAALPALSSRLLPGGRARDLAAHLELYGPLPPVADDRRDLIRLVEESGLTGRGGAAFPTAVKLRAVARGGRAVVVANGTEGEPASGKDKALMTRNPQLVLDGVLVAADLVGAAEAIVAISREDRPSIAALGSALRERPDAARVRVAAPPERFVTGEETALVSWLNGRDAKPAFTPPRPFESGVRGRPTLVQNVETLANLALVVRNGPAWFREAGTQAEPGTALVTVSGAVREPGVVEIALGTTLGDALELCGGLAAPPQAILVGGYFGTWLPPDLDLPLADEALRPLGGALGARALAVLPVGVCGVVETARVAGYLANQGAGQCGPCVFGLRAVAESLALVARREPGAAAALARLPRLGAQIAGRGACAHPDGAVGFVGSALSAFAGELDEHLAGRCSAIDHRPLLPTPATTPDWR